MQDKGGEDSEASLLKIQLREETLLKIRALQEQGFLEDKDLYYLVKNFFKQYLNLSYEFTTAELKTELKKIYFTDADREKLDQLLDYISVVEFLSETSREKRAQEYLTTFQQVVETIIAPEPSNVIRSALNKITLKDWCMYALEKLRFHSPPNDEQSRIRILLTEIEQGLESKNFEIAGKNYQELVKIYDSLSEPEKARYYSRISSLYSILAPTQHA